MSHGPTVSVVVCTYNRPRYLREALGSVLAQEYDDWELLVVNDGGVDVRGITEGLGDNRIRYFNRRENRGKAACLNFALRRARGEYVAYLDDDDRWYSNHLGVLVEALDHNLQAGGAYSDLYEVTVIKDDKGRRIPLQKAIRVCRDFSRPFMWHFNHVLHVSVMHRRELVLRAGGYDEDVKVLIDWNINRKLSFLADFVHVQKVTGEYFVHRKDSDRISDVQRRDRGKYMQNMRRIKADLPPEPWPFVRRVGVVLPLYGNSERERRVVKHVVDGLDYPCRIAFVDASEESTAVPEEVLELNNVQRVVCRNTAPEEAYLAGAKALNADLYYLLDSCAATDVQHRLTRGVHYLGNCGVNAVRWAEDDSESGPWNVLVTSEDLFNGQISCGERKSLTIATVPEDWLPSGLQSDELLTAARSLLVEGDYQAASALLAMVAETETGAIGDPFLMHLHGQVYFRLGKDEEAEKMSRRLVGRGYGADNLVRLGEIYRLRGKADDAVVWYRRALASLGLKESHLSLSVFPIRTRGECQAFVILSGLAECYLELGRLGRAARYLHMASRVCSSSPRPYLGFGCMFLQKGQFRSAREALQMARDKALGKDLARAESGLAEVYEHQSRPFLAWQHCEAAIAAAPDEDVWLEAAMRIAPEAGKEAELLQACELYLDHHPGDTRMLTFAARIHLKQGRPHLARERARKAALLDPDSPEPAQLLSVTAKSSL